MKTRLVLAFTLILAGCGRVDDKPQTVTASGSDGFLSTNVVGTASAVAKMEGSLRKVRLAEIILAKKLGLVSASLNPCVADSEIAANGTDWNWACQNGGTSGKSYFTMNGNALQKVELELDSDVTGFGTARENLTLLDVTDVTLNGVRSVTFKMTWDLYKNSITGTTQICTMTTAPIKLDVAQRVRVDENGHAVTEQYVPMIELNRLSLSCNPALTATTNDDVTLELKTAILSVTDDDNRLLTGSIGFDFKDAILTYSGTVALDSNNVRESRDNAATPWACFGQPLCFP